MIAKIEKSKTVYHRRTRRNTEKRSPESREIAEVARNLQKLAASSQELAAGCLVTITVYPVTAFANY